MIKILSFTKNQSFKKYLFIGIAIILIAVFCVTVTPIGLQNDTFYTVKIGELIYKNGIDMMDHFSWHSDLSYTYPHWLYDLLSYFIYSFSGFEGIHVATCILSCILGIILYYVTSKLSKNYIVPFLTTIGAIYLLSGYITARAQLVTFILFTLAVYCIEMFLKKTKKRYSLGLILISLLIANLHCAVWLFLFVLFLPYIAEYFISKLKDIAIYRKFDIFRLKKKVKKLEKNPKKQKKLLEYKKTLNNIEEKVKKLKEHREKENKTPYKLIIVSKPATKWLIVIMIICILVGFLTPIGTTPFTYLVKTMEGNTTQNINEHLPMTLSDEKAIIVSIVLILALLIFTKTKIQLSDLLMLSGLVYLMLFSRRQSSMYALIGSIILAKLITNFISIYFKDGVKSFTIFFTDIITIIVMIILTSLLSFYQIKDRLGETLIDESFYPVQACDYILENIDLSKTKFYNEYNYGSYMLFRGIPVFIDSRADLYSPEFNPELESDDEDIFSDFIDSSNIGVFYEDVFEKYGITHIILSKDSKINMIIQKAQKNKYEELYSDDYFIIYERLNY